MELESIMHSEIKPVEKHKYEMISPTFGKGNPRETA